VVKVLSMNIRTAAAILACLVMLGAPAAQAADALPSWNKGASKQAITAFVSKVTKAGSPDYVPVSRRIATFDNDGTLWAEQPLYFQFLFVIDRIKAMAPQHPEWQDTEPFASILKGDYTAALAGGEHEVLKLMKATHTGLTTEEFEAIVRDWFSKAKHPTTAKLYSEMVYQPMLELLAYLRANRFKTYIVSGGGIEFMRVFAEKVYGIPPEQVIGSTGKQALQYRGGRPIIVKLPGLDFNDDKEGKPLSIQKFIGRRPIAAFGNSDGDLQMLQWTCDTAGPHFCLYVHHTDAAREWAYDRASPIGRLDKGLDQAKVKGWTVVDMKRDWKRVFKFEK